ncbi:GDSL esterase/lipase At4g10955-like [Chenopodium quinoa]|uniref:Fungal lipase-like domain-containing protein n=1 Tax=Chenopodium quinoa TaxID=63459 RepID=A0A803L2K9_CHEQI|nr:GDSL esterase/lipase At4g10955-like [Chenopodium quinoa]XP_021764038.1 GDSL esterase/lipase At4g10955-like [Chenopodium quinoa]
MEGKRGEDSDAIFSKWEFGISGPVHLTSADWRNPDHTRSVVASLIQGVYVLERDRQNKRTGNKALAPAWWDYFHFQCMKTLIDQIDLSIFGAIFEYKPRVIIPQQGVPPRYVIVFRGTLMETDTRKRDLYLDIQLPFSRLTRDSRYLIAFQEIQGILEISPKNVLLAGHSLGAAIALQAGKDMAKRGCHIETYLFNPPYTSAPIEKINNTYLKGKIRIAKSIVTAGIYQVAKKGIKNYNNSTKQHDSYSSLCSWIPNLFVNPSDPICCEYIGHFEHRGRMKELGMDQVDLIVTKHSLMSMLVGALGKDGEPPHLIPSALLTKNVKNVVQSVKEAHCVNQWWEPHSYCHSKLYVFEP